MKTENLSTLTIHKLTQEQYNRELAAGRLDPNAIYLTPDEEVDLSAYATIEQLNQKADTEHTHEIGEITSLQSSLDQMLADSKAYTDEAVSGAVSAEHNHDNRYYTEVEIDEKFDSHFHSWNDLKDKPFGEETGVHELLAEQTLEFDVFAMSTAMAHIDTVSENALVLGNTYTVIWDGSVYENLTCFNDAGDPAIGSPSDVLTAEPFTISFWHDSDGYYYTIMAKSDESIHTVAIMEATDVVKQIEEKYIPDTIARTIYVDKSLAAKADVSHNHNDVYYTKSEIDNFELITINDIDAICGVVVGPSMITFTVNGTEYQAEEGMTWSEWYGSKYNTKGFTADGGYMSDSSGYSTIIQDGHKYFFIEDL